MFGQWIGSVEIDDASLPEEQRRRKGRCIACFDEDRPTLGLLQVVEPQVSYSAVVALENPDLFKGQVSAFQPHSPLPEGVRLPASGRIEGERIEGDPEKKTKPRIEGTWSSDIGTSGSFSLIEGEIPGPRSAHLSETWAEFRNWALDEYSGRRGMLFRGQSDSEFLLNTKLHRAGRRDLRRYAVDDIPRLLRHVESAIGSRYDPFNPLDYGALVSLAQHHGFPTPLLDWTESPFVAAYFAFRHVPRRPDPAKKARIFAFDAQSWPLHGGPLSIFEPDLRLTTRYFGARDNPRALPQRSVSMFSNVVDIENFIAWQEAELKRPFLVRMDLPWTERSTAMRELALMGITAASLFPGLDGVCAALEEAWEHER